MNPFWWLKVLWIAWNVHFYNFILFEFPAITLKRNNNAQQKVICHWNPLEGPFHKRGVPHFLTLPGFLTETTNPVWIQQASLKHTALLTARQHIYTERSFIPPLDKICKHNMTSTTSSLQTCYYRVLDNNKLACLHFCMTVGIFVYFYTHTPVNKT